MAVDGSGNMVVATTDFSSSPVSVTAYGPNATTKNWTQTAFSYAFGRGIYAAGIYVFISTPTTSAPFIGVYTSPDGTTWTQRSSGNLAAYFYGLSYANGLFFVLGNGTLRSSADGITWTSRTAMAGIAYSICKSTSYYVMVGASGSIRTTTDLVTLTTRTSGVSWNIYSVAAIGNTVIAAGAGEGIIRSTDGGVTWSSISYTASNIDYLDVVTDGSQFVVYGGPSLGVTNSPIAVLTSPDGVTWTNRALPMVTAYNGGGQLTYANGNYYLAVSGNGNTVNRTVFTSADAYTWSLYSTSAIYYGMFYISDTGTFIACNNNGYILTSTNNGATWTPRRNQTVSSSVLTWSIAYGAGLYVTVGTGSIVRSSPDLVTWTARTNAPQSSAYSIVYGGGKFVYVTTDWAVYSSNGISWTNVAITGGALRGITYGNSLYVVVGGSGYIATSPDAITWTQRTVSGTPSFTGVCWTGSLFVAVGSSGAIHTSPDGITWTSRTSGITNTLRAVSYIGSTIVAVGDASRILTSTNGVTWTARTSADSTKGFYGVAGNSSVALVCGTNGYIVINP